MTHPRNRTNHHKSESKIARNTAPTPSFSAKSITSLAPPHRSRQWVRRSSRPTNYLLHYFNSPAAIDFMLGSRVTTAQPNMSLTDIREFPIPFPPLAEQHRIVAKVDELMAVCDRLEASLGEGDDKRRRLLDALVAEVLTADESDLEQAA
jgi:restriction endonuclease S subunit